MKKIKEVCLICGHNFYHFPSQPKQYCDDCMKKDIAKTCEHCGSSFSRNFREKMNIFIDRNLCNKCVENGRVPFTTGREGIIFKALILGSDDCVRSAPDKDVLELVILENYALFRLYFLYLLLLPYDDGSELKDRLPSTQLYLEDILRRIRNIEEVISLSKKVRERIRTRVDKWETGPTDDDLIAIQREQRSHIASIKM